MFNLSINQVFNLNLLYKRRQFGVGFDYYFSKFFFSFYKKYLFFNTNIFFLSLRRSLRFVEFLTSNSGNTFMFYPNKFDIEKKFFEFFKHFFLFNLKKLSNGFVSNYFKHPFIYKIAQKTRAVKESKNLINSQFILKVSKRKKWSRVLIPSCFFFFCDWSERMYWLINEGKVTKTPMICFVDYMISRDFFNQISYPIFLNINYDKFDKLFWFFFSLILKVIFLGYKKKFLSFNWKLLNFINKKNFSYRKLSKFSIKGFEINKRLKF